MVPLDVQDETSWEAAEQAAGEEGLDAYLDMAPSKRLNAVLREHLLDGAQFDGFVFYDHLLDTGGNTSSAEGVIFNPSRVVQIQSRTLVEPPKPA